RPLFDPDAESDDTETKDTGDITRDYSVLDHEKRDGVSGLTTIVGGKLTTYRQMAEAVTDHVCDVFGVDAACHTHEEPLPGSRKSSTSTNRIPWSVPVRP